jgi:DNA-3-methyladenine glycosylase
MTAGLRATLGGPVLEAARALLGRRLTSDIGGVRCEVVITDVEAYDGATDPASHAYRGRTLRTEVMFGPAGHLYVYRSYGIHWCMNVVTGFDGVAAAVLLRGGAPVAGIGTMELRRGRADHLADGPGKLCQALGVIGEHDGLDLWDGPLRLSDEDPLSGSISTTPRIGISKAKGRLWRFVLEPGD